MACARPVALHSQAVQLLLLLLLALLLVIQDLLQGGQLGWGDAAELVEEEELGCVKGGQRGLVRGRLTRYVKRRTACGIELVPRSLVVLERAHSTSGKVMRCDASGHKHCGRRGVLRKELLILLDSCG